MTEQELLAALREIDTPTITNVVATYPTNPLCLGLYNPWTENWYTDTSIRCIYPELGPVIGYAVTCVYGMPDPNYPNRLTYQDVIEALDASPKPTVLVIQQKWPPEIFNKAGLAGEIMTTTAMAVGCIGLLSNGPSRDIDAIRRNKFQMLLGGVTARSRRDGRHGRPGAGIGRRHGCRAGRAHPHGRKRRGQVPPVPDGTGGDQRARDARSRSGAHRAAESRADRRRGTRCLDG